MTLTETGALSINGQMTCGGKLKASNFGDDDNNNLFVGKITDPNTTTGSDNISIGTSSGINLTAGNDNVLIGRLTGIKTTSSYNVAIGCCCLGKPEAGDQTGTNNVVLGSGSLRSLTSGSKNVILGSDSGNNLSTGSFNVTIGAGDVFESVADTNKKLRIGIYDGTDQQLIGGQFDTGVLELGQANGTSIIKTLGTTDSTSITTGSVQIAGGMAVKKKITCDYLNVLTNIKLQPEGGDLAIDMDMDGTIKCGRITTTGINGYTPVGGKYQLIRPDPTPVTWNSTQSPTTLFPTGIESDVGSRIFATNDFAVGASYHIRASGKLTNNGSNDNAEAWVGLRLTIGAVDLLPMWNYYIKPTDAQSVTWELEADVVMRDDVPDPIIFDSFNKHVHTTAVYAYIDTPVISESYRGNTSSDSTLVPYPAQNNGWQFDIKVNFLDTVDKEASIIMESCTITRTY